MRVCENASVRDLYECVCGVSVCKHARERVCECE